MIPYIVREHARALVDSRQDRCRPHRRESLQACPGGAGVVTGSGAGGHHHLVLRLMVRMRMNMDCNTTRSHGAGARRCARRFHRGNVMMKGFARAVAAFAAAGGHTRLGLQFVEAGATLAGGLGDVPVGDAAADANYHTSTVMRMVRIGKCAGMSDRRTGSAVRTGQEPSCDCR